MNRRTLLRLVATVSLTVAVTSGCGALDPDDLGREVDQSDRSDQFDDESDDLGDPTGEDEPDEDEPDENEDESGGDDD